ncbi:hypothetical protein [Arthrobacter psychrolactophilus]
MTNSGLGHSAVAVAGTDALLIPQMFAKASWMKFVSEEFLLETSTFTVLATLSTVTRFVFALASLAFAFTIVAAARFGDEVQLALLVDLPHSYATASAAESAPF